jgi:adenylate cyclase class 2
MTKEYEYRFLFNNASSHKLTSKTFRNELIRLGAIHVKPVLYKVYTYNCISNEKLYVRLRDEGFRITFTVKVKSTDINNMFDDEYEVIINDMEIANNMLQLLGCSMKHKVEKLRETFDFSNAQIIFDYYPGLPPYFEIEAQNEEILNDYLKKFNLDKNDHVTYDIYTKYYGLDSNRKIKGDLTFDTIYDKYINSITKNKSKFEKILQKQLTYISKINQMSN